MTVRERAHSLCAIFLLLTSATAYAADPFLYVPDTVSPEAQERLAATKDPAKTPPLPAPDDHEAWYELQERISSGMKERQAPIAHRLGATWEERIIGGIRCLEVTPRDWDGSDRRLVYVHGGAYVMFSADSHIGVAAQLAERTGLRVISVDYTLAPRGRWRNVTGEVVQVLRGLDDAGISLSSVGMLGDSAGGALVAGSVLRARDEGIDLPGAVVLWSPWSDISDRGDSYATLRNAEPTYLYDLHLEPAALAYADEADHRHPWVSPAYGDYGKGFPPTLIQGGTKEIFLSNFVRHYQAIDQAGQTVKLDLYEGMTHVFQGTMAGTPEADLAFRKTRDFLVTHLD